MNAHLISDVTTAAPSSWTHVFMRRPLGLLHAVLPITALVTVTVVYSLCNPGGNGAVPTTLNPCRTFTIKVGWMTTQIKVEGNHFTTSWIILGQTFSCTDFRASRPSLNPDFHCSYMGTNLGVSASSPRFSTNFMRGEKGISPPPPLPSLKFRMAFLLSVIPFTVTLSVSHSLSSHWILRKFPTGLLMI